MVVKTHITFKNDLIVIRLKGGNMANTSLKDSTYVILVNDDNSMVATQKCRIVQRSKLVDNLWFLVKPMYGSHDMSKFTVLLEYLTPVSNKYRTEILELSDSDYNGYLKYVLPIDTKITSEAGDVQLQLSFLSVGVDIQGNIEQYARKVTGGKINIAPITSWSDIVPDEALCALDRRIIKMDAQINAIVEASDQLHITKADNITFNKEMNTIQLTSDGNPIGNEITLSHYESSLEDGVPVVDITHTSDTPDLPFEDDVIEF